MYVLTLFNIFFQICVLGCYKPIEGKYYVIQNDKCHSACFTCVTCQKPFDDGVFYPVDDRVYCFEYHWGAKCINSGEIGKKPILRNFTFCN